MAKLRHKDVEAKYSQIISDLDKKIYKPVYLLMGEEPYYIDKVVDYIITKVLSDAEKSFNQTVVYGQDVSATQVSDMARRFPMMANHQVLVIREAQNLDKVDLLEAYMKHPQPSTILVLAFKGKLMDKRKTLYKAIGKIGEVLETATLYDNEVPAWVVGYLRTKGYAIEATAAAILAEALGADLSKIVNELDKLMLVLPPNVKQITAAHIETNIGISKEYNTFELNSAVLKKEVLKANRILLHFDKNPRTYPIVLTLTSLHSQFYKLFIYQMLKLQYGGNVPDTELRNVARIEPFFKSEYEAATKRYTTTKVTQVLALLREYDLRSKGWNNTSATHGDLLRELVYKIMH